MKKTKEVAWEYVWTLFPLGTEVVARQFSDLDQIFIVSHHRMQGDEFVVSCWTYDWNGIELVKQLYMFKISRFLATKPVNLKEFPCIPLAYYGDKDSDPEKLRRDLIKRGMRFKDLNVRSEHDEAMFRCCGPITVNDEPGYIDPLSSKAVKFPRTPLMTFGGPKSPKFDVIVDAYLYGQYALPTHPVPPRVPTSKHSCDCQLCGLSGSRKLWEELFQKPGSKNDWYSGLDQGTYEKFFSLLPPWVLGYVMDLKKWAQLPVDSIESFDHMDAEKGWDELSLEADYKQTIRQLVSAHIERTQVERPEVAIIKDIIPGKGEGLVILLHGKLSTLPPDPERNVLNRGKVFLELERR
jgi:hypothetical protein